MNRQRVVFILGLLAIVATGLSTARWTKVEPRKNAKGSLPLRQPLAANPAGKSAVIQKAATRVQLKGRVVDEEGSPVANALIGSTSAHVDTLQTDAAGAFELDQLPGAGTQIYVVARGFADRHLLLPPAASATTIVLAKEAAVRGRLTRPAPADLMVSICKPLEESDQTPFCVARVLVAAGSQAFAFHRLTAGAHELFIERSETLVMKMPLHIRSGQEIDVGEIDTNLISL